MTSSQIKQLRLSFNKMSTKEKEVFIKRLKDQRFHDVQWQLNREDNAQFSKFLSECTRKYNEELRDAALRGGSPASAPSQLKKKETRMWH